MVLAFVPKTVQAQNTVTLEQPSSGDGTEGNPYQIASAGNLYWFANEVNNSQTSICAVLTADITVNENVLDADGNLNSENTDFYEWTPIGGSNSYVGTFDGQGHTISGLYINKEIQSENTVNLDLFGSIGSEGVIQNVGVEDSYFNVTVYSPKKGEGVLCAGGVCGRNEGTITNCYSSGTISGTTRETKDGAMIGGVCGYNYKGTITNCYNTGAICGTVNNAFVGGVCGTNSNTITNCYNTGTVSGTGNSVGGVCGNNSNNNTITNCYYLKDENNPKYPTKGIGNISDVAGSVEGKYANEFTNGSVAWLLNGNATDDNTTPEKTLPWLQNIGVDASPVLKANTTGGVCPIVVKDGEGNYTNGKHSYKNTAATPDAGTENLYSYICSNCMGLSTDQKVIKRLNGKDYPYEIILKKNGSEWETITAAILDDDPSKNWYKAPVEFMMKSNVFHDRKIATKWSTICLPFQITISNYADKCKFYELKSVETDKITLTELTENIEAGTPVFIKRNSESVTEIRFVESDVKMIQTPKEQTANGNRLVGAFNTVELTMDDNSNCLFLKKDNMWSVTQANKTMTVKPFRAYIVPATSNGILQRSIAVDGEATAISDALDTLNDANAEYYDMCGRRINGLQKGVNIIRSGNKTRKVIIK